MQDQPTSDLVESLAEDLVLIDVEDLPALAALHTKFQTLAATPEAEQCTKISELALQSAALIETIILREVEDTNQVLDKLNHAVVAIQAVVRDGRNAADVAFPDMGIELPAVEQPKQKTDVHPKKDEIFFDGEQPVDSPSPPPSAKKVALTLPANVEPSVFSSFLEAQSSAVDDMEHLILDLEKPDSQEPLEELKRLLHTLKGESGMMGLVEIESLCHCTEDALSSSNPSDLTDQLLSVKDWLQKSLDSYGGRGDAPEGLDTLMGQLHKSAKPVETVKLLPAPKGADEMSLLEDFISEAKEHLEGVDVHLLTIESAPDDQEALNAIFRAFHTIKGVAGFLDLRDVMEVAHEAENLLDLARKRTLPMVGAAVDVTFTAADTLSRYVAKWSEFISTGQPPRWEPGHPGILERIRRVASGVEIDSLDAAEELASEKQPAEEVATASRGAAVERKDVVKVDAKRLDKIVDAIGELVIAVSMVRQSSSMEGSTDYSRQLAHLDKITRELQEMGTSLRMVPIRPVFQKMARLARDLSKKVQKKVDFVMTGEDTELDKTVVDQISDPLVHMIRNAVDHGLEDDPRDRMAVGKNEVGRVELKAYHQGGNIIVEVSDDGRGLNKEAIVRKARDRGLISESDVLSDSEIFNLIFHPGLSTARNVTDVSGRGVGMDVVKKNIEGLRGHVNVASAPNQGSTFRIVLPLTLAIIDGMSVRVGKERYIIPTLSIVASLRPEKSVLTTVLGRGEMLTFQNELIPLTRLHRLFNISGAETDLLKGLVVLVENQGRKSGLVVDELLGQQQIVIKTLGETMRGLPGVAGGAIMPDGNVGLILDVAGLVDVVKRNDFKDCA